MPFTEGGFPASPDPVFLGLVDAKIPGTNVNFPGGVASFAAPLLMWVAQQIHETVEPAHDGWCWGWNYRDVRGGSTVMSDHAGGVAIDYNAPSHPRGVTGTWSSKQVVAIQRILAQANRDTVVVTWGHWFNTTVDDMHFACRGTKAEVIAAGKRLTTETDWFDMATKADLRDVLDEKISAGNPAFLNAVRVAIEAERAEDAAAVWDHKLVNAVSGEDQKAGTFLRYMPKRFAEILAAVKP